MSHVTASHTGGMGMWGSLCDCVGDDGVGGKPGKGEGKGVFV